jgi:alcohol dehydrogenase YqhD (iron-dependent ADH family)
MPVTISDLGVRPTNEEIRALALDATANDQMKLSRIRPLDAKAVEEIYKAAL